MSRQGDCTHVICQRDLSDFSYLVTDLAIPLMAVNLC